MYLGIDSETGLVYEGPPTQPELPVIPTPTISQATLIEKPEDYVNLPPPRQFHETWVFREDAFDAVTRTRRGRLYQSITGISYPDRTARVVPHPWADPHGRTMGSAGKVLRPLNIFAECTTLLLMPLSGQGSVLALGNNRGASRWRITSSEVTIAGDVMLTLKAMSHFGIIPELNRSKVPDEFLGDINHALDRVLNSAFRETPVSAVDQCRNAVTVILSRWLVQIGYDRAKALMLDLGEIAKAVEAQKDSRECAANLAKVIARLHSRGKMNVQQSLRQVTEEDAELAVQMVGFTLREVGWAV